MKPPFEGINILIKMPNVDQKKITKHVIMHFSYIYGSDLRDIFLSVIVVTSLLGDIVLEIRI